VLLFALSSEIAAKVSGQFTDGTVRKRYLAVVRGYCPEGGEVDHPITDKPDRLADGHRTREPQEKSALTRFRRLATAEIQQAVDRYPQSRYSLMSLEPKQGRKHQLRRHMKHLGYPIIGDAKHGKGVHNRFFRRRYHCGRLLLACISLEILHPLTGGRLRLEADVDPPFYRVIDAFGWRDELQAVLHAAP